MKTTASVPPEAPVTPEHSATLGGLMSLLFLKIIFIYFWLFWVFVASDVFSLAVASGDTLLWCSGVSLWGFSVLEHRPSSRGPQA